MGKEAKFGLAVIVVLLITFGVVLASRLKGTGSESPTASSDKDEKTSSPADAQTRSPEKTADRRALVAEKPSLTGSNGMPDTLNQWNVVSDSDPEDSTLPAQPPSPYMPNPSASSSVDPYDPYAGSSSYEGYRSGQQQTPGSSAGATASSTAGADTQAMAGASDPFGNRSGGTTSSTVNVIGPPPSPPSLPSSGGDSMTVPSAAPYGSPYSSRSMYPSGGSTLPSSPATSQSSPYSSSAPTTSSSLYSPSAAPVSTHASSTYASSTYASPTDSGDPNARNENGEYEVQPNDSYWRISERLYGSGAYFRALVEHNRDRVPREDRLDVGAIISAPTVAELEQAYPDLCPSPSRRETVRNLAQAASMHSPYSGGPTYVVQKGDTLYDIARYELGNASRWSEIHALNSNILGKDYDYLVPGTPLTMPGSETSDTVTSRPATGSIYQR